MARSATLGYDGEAMILPIHHPEYRYPPSKNPYWTFLRNTIEGVFLDNETEVNRGQWKSILEARAGKKLDDLRVEIGCNGGHVVLEWAAQNPSTAFLGLDWKFKQIHRGHEKAEKRSLKNLAFLRAHATRMDQMFAEGEIDQLFLFFPDPWPKKAQNKNRLFQVDWLKRTAPLIRKGGTFEIRTDHPAYFKWMLAEFAQAPGLFTVVDQTFDRYAGQPDAVKLKIPEVTLFEKLFIKDGIPIHRLLLKKI